VISIVTNYTTRLITPEDIPVIAEWWERPGAAFFDPLILPELGVAAEDERGLIAAVWVYLAVDVGVAFLEHACTRPGLTIQGSTAAIQAVMIAAEEACVALNYTYLVAHTRRGAARVLEPIGWEGGDFKLTVFNKNVQDRVADEWLRTACVSG
jgi:hypothetical protein